MSLDQDTLQQSLSHTAFDSNIFNPVLETGRAENDRVQLSPAVPKAPEQDVEMDDLFGVDNHLEELQQQTERTTSEHDTEPGRELRDPLEYDEDDQPPVEAILQRKEADVVIPTIPVPHSSNGEIWVIRMPNYVNVDPKPFHPDTYVGPEQEDEDSYQAENIRFQSMSIKLKVENTVRWRWIKDASGQDRRQSNSRIIRWSDGSLSLRLGKELFDITKKIDTSGGIPRQSFGGLQSQDSSLTSSQPNVTTRNQGLTYLVAQHKRSQVLQAEALIAGSMTLRPYDMQSETHRALVRAVGQKHNKVARLRMAPDPKMDPEREKIELMKLSAKKAKKKAEEDGFGGRRKRTAHSRKRAGHDVWSDDDDVAHEYAVSDEENAEITDGTPRKKGKSADREGGDYQEDDFLVADSTDDEGKGSTEKRRDRGKHEEEDLLDKLDDKIQAQAEERRHRRESGGDSDIAREDDGQGGFEEEMDVESEEDEIGVRRTGPGVRKKRAIDFEEEEEDE